jgi:hypothetical protein
MDVATQTAEVDDKWRTREHVFVLLFGLGALLWSRETWNAFMIGLAIYLYRDMWLTKMRRGLLAYITTAGVPFIVAWHVRNITVDVRATPIGSEVITQVALSATIAVVCAYLYAKTFGITTYLKGVFFQTSSLACVGAGITAGLLTGFIYVGLAWNVGASVPFNLSLPLVLMTPTVALLGVGCAMNIKRRSGLDVDAPATFGMYALPILLALAAGMHVVIAIR